jgi:hypothetical protein
MRRSMIGLLVVAAVAAAAWTLWPNEERKVRARLEALAATVSVPPTETGLARAARAAGARSFFAPDVRVELPDSVGPSLHGRDEIVGLVARLPVPPEGTRVELLDLKVEVAGDQADARANARLLTADVKDPQILDARMVALTLRKVDGSWLVASARVMPTDDSLGAR